MPVAPGVDELALALTADAYARTGRSRAVTLARRRGPVPMRGRLRLLPDRVTAADSRAAQALGVDVVLHSARAAAGAHALDVALDGITACYGPLRPATARYGPHTAAWVALQVEYARPAAARRRAS